MARVSSKFFAAVRNCLGPLVLTLLVILMMAEALFSDGRLVPSQFGTDLHLYFIPVRFFAFSQWKAGHFPLWSPRVFCGIPFFAQLQTNLLYPIAWINFFLNTATATTIELAANVSIAAICAYIWARKRGISRCGATLAGAVFAFSGGVYLRVLAGHISPLASIAWAPLVFVAVDLLLAQRWLAGVLLGAAAVCLQCLGGYPQYAYFTLLVAGSYLLLQSIGKQRILRMYAGFAAIYVLAGMLSAAQTIPSYYSTDFSIRHGGTSYKFSSALSLPPESLLTIFIPYPFGDATHVDYVGRWYMWEMSAYAGIISVALALIALFSKKRNDAWRMAALLGVILILMVGSYTPVHLFLYHYFPGFRMFRGASKFAALWGLVIGMLAGEGFDRIKTASVGKIAIALLAMGAALCLVASSIAYSATGHNLVGQMMHVVVQSGEYFNARVFAQFGVSDQIAEWMGRQWLIAGLLLAAMGVLLYLRKKWPFAAYAILALCIAEVFTAAAVSSTTAPGALLYPKEWKTLTENAIAHDQRLLFGSSWYMGNLGYLIGYNSLWGYEPGQPWRYTELFAHSQGEPPDVPDEYTFNLKQKSHLFALLRCCAILPRVPGDAVQSVNNPLPHLELIGQCTIEQDDQKIMSALCSNNFDYRGTAIVGAAPVIAPTVAGTKGKVQLIQQTINDLEIEADLPAPALLLVTDAYAPGWHVKPLEDHPPQASYDVMRADDVLRAIPLAAGHHHFDLYYFPPGLTCGIALSVAGIILWFGGAAYLLRASQRNHPVS